MAMVRHGEVYHYHLDHLGTPQEIINSQGQLVWAGQFKAYGNLALKRVNEIENNLRFQGQYFDEESGLHYNRHRYYDPNCGQFITQDPIGLLGGINNYQYVPNPTGWVDPLGLTSKDCYIPDFDEFEAGQGFSGVYDPITGRILLVPSQAGRMGELPDGFVPRQGGHHYLREIMRNDGYDVSQLRGFSGVLDEAGNFDLRFTSGQLNINIPGSNGRDLALSERPVIEQAFESATGRMVNNPTK